MKREEVVQLIVESVREVHGSTATPIDDATHLFGRNALLDSVDLVTVVVDVEQKLNEKLGIQLALADDRAMSQERSPFRTVGSLADYVMGLLA